MAMPEIATCQLVTICYSPCLKPINMILFYRIAGNFRVVQNFAVFSDRSAYAKIKTVKIVAITISIMPHLPMCAGAVEIKTAKFLRAPSEEILHPQKFLAMQCITPTMSSTGWLVWTPL